MKLINEYRNDFPTLIHRAQYNVRRRRLFAKIEDVRQRLAQTLTAQEHIFLIDSMPLEVCKLARAHRSSICKETFDTAPDKGFCASQQSYFYGYKLHGVCTMNGVFTAFDITKASVHDIHYLHDVKTKLANAVLLGDKAYLSEDIRLDLFSSVRIHLKTPMRTNQYNYHPQPACFKRARKRIETLFSQLCDQFLIRRNYAKSFLGFKTRILSKLTALTMAQYFNKFFNEKPINHIKYALA